MSEMIFLGPAKKFDTILIFLGIKSKNTDNFGFSCDFHICIKCIVQRPNWLRLVLPIVNHVIVLFGSFIPLEV